jgi:hypothetical protein
LSVSGNDWRRHNKEMDHRGRVPPILAGKRNRTLDLKKTTLASSVIAQTVGLNAEKGSSVRSRRGDVSLDIPFYRTIRMVAGPRNQFVIDKAGILDSGLFLCGRPAKSFIESPRRPIIRFLRPSVMAAVC